MAGAANAGRKPAAHNLRIVAEQNITRADGRASDSGGRPLERGPDFPRQAPQKPEGLSPDAAEMWDKIVAQMVGVGLLKPLDAMALEVACETFARWRDAVRKRREHGQLGKNSQGVVTAPWVGIEERASKEFRAWCAEFGITPAAERHLTGPMGAPEDEGNPFL